MSSRQLSLLRKTILINTLILAKTTFLSNIFPIPQNTIHKIYKMIFQYLWQNKTPEPIARKTLFLPKNKGGLNLKEIEDHNYAMRTKYLLTLKQKENHPQPSGCVWLCTGWGKISRTTTNFLNTFRIIIS